MKIRNLIPVFFILSLLIPASEAQDKDTGSEIIQLIGRGSARDLARHFNNTIQLTLPDDEGRYSRTQAELIVREFFTKYPPKSFTLSHQGSSSDGSRYFIGVYKTGNDSFQTYFLLKRVNGQELLHQLRFEIND